MITLYHSASSEKPSRPFCALSSPGVKHLGQTVQFDNTQSHAANASPHMQLDRLLCNEWFDEAETRNLFFPSVSRLCNSDRDRNTAIGLVEFDKKSFVPIVDEPWQSGKYYADFARASSSVMSSMEGQAIDFRMKDENSFDDAIPGIDIWNTINSNRDFPLMTYQNLHAAYGLSMINSGFPKPVLFGNKLWDLPDEGWHSVSSFNDQSDCGQFTSSLASSDHPFAAGTYFNGDLNSYTSINSPRKRSQHTCQEKGFGDMQASLFDPRLATNVQFVDGGEFFQESVKEPLRMAESLVDQTSLPDIVIEEDGQKSNYTSEDRYQDPKTGLSISVGDPESLQTLSTLHGSSLEPQQEYCWLIGLPQGIHSRTGATHCINLQTENRASAQTAQEKTAQMSEGLSNGKEVGGFNTIRYITPRRKTEDYFLVTSRRAGMTYKEIKQRGGLRAAESTLRGRFRALTKARKDRVRKPVWTERDIRLLEEAVKIDLKELEITKVCRGMDESTKLSKVSWKSISEYIATKGGSYQFGNATCKKKWNEIHGTC